MGAVPVATTSTFGGYLPNRYLGLPGRATLDRAYVHDRDDGRLMLAVFPADTLAQAQALYGRRDVVYRLLSLRETGWKVRPNFHFGFVAKNLVWTTVDAPVEDYVSYWCDHARHAGAYRREQWGEVWTEMVRLRFARQSDRAQFDRDFTRTARNQAVPRPGLACEYYWDPEKAERLFSQRSLVEAVLGQLNTVLAALGEPPYVPVTRTEERNQP